MREAGAIARSFFGGDYKRWDKGKGQPVTEADLAVDRYLRETLRAARPDYGWLSEETDDDLARLAAENTFVVDPIDGTVAFMKARPHFSISVAVVRAGRPITACVYNPISEEFFTAAKGEGATLNGAPIHVSARTEVEGAACWRRKACSSIPPGMFRRSPPGPRCRSKTATPSPTAWRWSRPARFDAALVLSTKRDWDMAAADLIVHEAGGVVTDHTGAVLHYNRAETLQPSMVCAGPALHPRLLERLRNLTLPRA